MMLEKITTQMQFVAKHVDLGTEETFTDQNPPSWLSCADAVPDSTDDDSWFWREHVLALSVGKSVATDFTVITRLA